MIMNKISLILSLLVLLFPSIYKSATTYQYKCADELKIDTCYLRTKNESGENTAVTYYLKGCSKNKKCQAIETSNGEDLNQCVKVKEFREDGDSCEVNEECQSGNCLSGKCAYIADGQKCENSYSCQRNYRCNDNERVEAESVCVTLKASGAECENNYQCGFGLLCNTAVTPHMCTEMFSVENGKESDKDFLCKSGRQYHWKCATTKTENSTCSESTNSCKITYSNGESEQTVEQSCEKSSENSDINSQYFCPLPSDSKEMKDYIEVYKKEREKLNKDDIDKIHVGNMEDKDRYTLNGHKKVLEAYVNLQYYKIIGDNDCIRDYFISEQSANKNKLSILIMLILSLFMI